MEPTGFADFPWETTTSSGAGSGRMGRDVDPGQGGRRLGPQGHKQTTWVGTCIPHTRHICSLTGTLVSMDTALQAATTVSCHPRALEFVGGGRHPIGQGKKKLISRGWMAAVLGAACRVPLHREGESRVGHKIHLQRTQVIYAQEQKEPVVICFFTGLKNRD